VERQEMLKWKKFRNVIGNNDVVELKPLKVTLAKNVAKHF